MRTYIAEVRHALMRACIAHLVVWCNSLCEEDGRRRSGFPKRTKTTLRFSTAGEVEK